MRDDEDKATHDDSLYPEDQRPEDRAFDRRQDQRPPHDRTVHATAPLSDRELCGLGEVCGAGPDGLTGTRADHEAKKRTHPHCHAFMSAAPEAEPEFFTGRVTRGPRPEQPFPVGWRDYSEKVPFPMRPEIPARTVYGSDALPFGHPARLSRENGPAREPETRNSGTGTVSAEDGKIGINQLPMDGWTDLGTLEDILKRLEAAEKQVAVSNALVDCEVAQKKQAWRDLVEMREILKASNTSRDAWRNRNGEKNAEIARLEDIKNSQAAIILGERRRAEQAEAINKQQIPVIAAMGDLCGERLCKIFRLEGELLEARRKIQSLNDKITRDACLAAEQHRSVVGQRNTSCEAGPDCVICRSRQTKG